MTPRGPLVPWQTGHRVTTSTLISTLTSTPLPALATIGDPEGTRTVTSIVALLVAIGLALLLLAVWIFRTTRPDPELLAPLEAMGERSWRRGDPVWQRRRLDALRPKGARPLAPSVAPPELDASFDAGPTASGFDDLRAPSTSSGEHRTVRGGSWSQHLDGGGKPDDDATTGLAGVDGAQHPDADELDDADDRSVDVADDDPVDDVASSSDSTPSGVVGPTLDQFPDDEFDAEALAAAEAELERELAESRDASAAQQLDLFYRDPRS